MLEEKDRDLLRSWAAAAAAADDDEVLFVRVVLGLIRVSAIGGYGAAGIFPFALLMVLPFVFPYVYVLASNIEE
jgi:hypothetical protein